MVETLKMDDSWIEQKREKTADSFGTSKYENISNELTQVRNCQKIEQQQQATKLKILLSLEDFWIKKEDFELINKDGILVIISNSSYFSSIVGLNWIQEKKNSRSAKNRSNYDVFDKQMDDSLMLGISKDDAQKQLKKYCEENNLDFESIIVWWGCVISEWDFSLVWIKRVVWESWDIIEKNRWTIAHEGQHIKFNNYRKEKWIEQNWNLAILDEIIAHCFNTFDEIWNIDFTKIFNNMGTNENYFKNSWIKKREDYNSKLEEIVKRVKTELQREEHKNLSFQEQIVSVMKSLIEEYKNK